MLSVRAACLRFQRWQRSTISPCRRRPTSASQGREPGHVHHQEFGDHDHGASPRPRVCFAEVFLYAFWLPISGLAFVGIGAKRKRCLAGTFVLCTIAFVIVQVGCSSLGSTPLPRTGPPRGLTPSH